MIMKYTYALKNYFKERHFNLNQELNPRPLDFDL
jgi:hypothetical protein